MMQARGASRVGFVLLTMLLATAVFMVSGAKAEAVDWQEILFGPSQQQWREENRAYGYDRCTDSIDQTVEECRASVDAAVDGGDIDIQAGYAPGTNIGSGGRLLLGGARTASTAAQAATSGARLSAQGVKVGQSVAMQVGIAGTLARQYNVDPETTDLVQSSGGEPGWVGGLNTFAGGRVVFTSVSDPAAGLTGTMTLRVDSTICPAGMDYYVCRSAWESYFGVDGRLSIEAVSGAGGSSFGFTAFFVWNGSQYVPASRTVTLTKTSDETFVRAQLLGSADQITYYPVGHSLRPEPAPDGLTGTVSNTINCKDSAGAITAYTYTQELSGGTVIDLPEQLCPAGTVLVDSVDTFQAPGSEVQTIGQAGNPDWVTNIPTEFPNCLSTACELSLWNVTNGQTPANCGNYALGCPDWWTDAAKADNYRCQFGTYEVPLMDCAAFRKAGAVSPTEGMIYDPQGKYDMEALKDLTQDQKIAKLDEMIRELEDWKKANPDKVPVVNPQPEPVPPGVTDPDVNKPDGQRCFPSGWGLMNPVSWVLQPLKCAFIPKQGLSAPKTSAMIQASGVGLVTSGVAGVGSAVVSIFDLGGSSCGEIINTPLNMFVQAGGPAEPFIVSSCSPIISAVGNVVRPALIVLSIVATFFTAANAIALGFDIKILERMTRNRD
jgi:hypothetical protein